MVELKIIIDSREAVTSRIKDYLTKFGVGTMIQPLPVADYYIPSFDNNLKSCLIERKTVMDFVHGISSKRIWDQLKAMTSNEDITPVFLLEGSLAKIRRYSNWNIKSLSSLFLSIHFDWKILTIQSPSEFWSSVFIMEIAKRLQEGKKERIKPLRVSPVSMDDFERARFILEGFPRIGPVYAVRLLDKFKSLRNIFNAEEAELRKVVGPKRAKDMFNLIVEEFQVPEKLRLKYTEDNDES